MMNKKNAADLMKIADNIGLVEILNVFEKPLKIKIPMTARIWDENIDVLRLSVRSSNALMRCQLDTIGKLSEQIMTEDGMNHIRNLGRKSIAEIKTTLLVYCYDELTANERLAFWGFVVENNG